MRGTIFIEQTRAHQEHIQRNVVDGRGISIILC